MVGAQCVNGKWLPFLQCRLPIVAISVFFVLMALRTVSVDALALLPARTGGKLKLELSFCWTYLLAALNYLLESGVAALVPLEMIRVHLPKLAL